MGVPGRGPAPRAYEKRSEQHRRLTLGGVGTIVVA